MILEVQRHGPEKRPACSRPAPAAGMARVGFSREMAEGRQDMPLLRGAAEIPGPLSVQKRRPPHRACLIDGAAAGKKR